MRDREGSREARSAERNTGVGDYQNGRARNLLHLLYSSATAAYSYASIPPLRSTDTPRRLARKPPGASPHDIIAMDYRDTRNATEASYCLRTSLTIRTKRWRELGDERVQRFISSFFFLKLTEWKRDRDTSRCTVFYRFWFTGATITRRVVVRQKVLPLKREIVTRSWYVINATSTSYTRHVWHSQKNKILRSSVQIFSVVLTRADAIII